jgi:hypothetical protein
MCLRTAHGAQLISQRPEKLLNGRIGGCSAFGVFFEKFNRIADGQNRLGGIVRNFTVELLFECHHELNSVETVGTKIVDETRRFGHLVGFHTQVLHHDLFYPLANVTHRSNLVLFRLGCGPEQVATIVDALVVVDFSAANTDRRALLATSTIGHPSRAEVRLPYFKSVD